MHPETSYKVKKEYKVLQTILLGIIKMFQEKALWD